MNRNRIGKITGSRVGAILGLNPYQSKNQILKEMIFEALGKSVVKNNADIQRGIALECVGFELAKDLNKNIKEGYFKLHDEYSFLGATPDGIGEDFVVEIKAPRKFYDEIPDMYHAQIQLQMHVFNVNKCFFIQIVGNENHTQWVEREEDFIQKNLNIFKDFIGLYNNALKNQNNFILTSLSQELSELREQQAQLKKQEGRIKEEILQELEGKEFINEFILVKKKNLSPNIDYKGFLKANNLQITPEYIKERGTTWEIQLI